MRLFISAGIIAVWTMLSRILGFVRDILIANLLGATPLAEAFVVAFRLPNLFRRLFADGALLSAIVPIYGKVQQQNGSKAAAIFAGQGFYLLSIGIIGFSALMMLFMDKVILLLAPGFEQREDIKNMIALTSDLAMIAFPYLGAMVLSSLLAGILNSHGRFWVAAAAPVLLNIAMISVMLLSLFTPFNNVVYGLVWAVFFAGILQLSLLLYHIMKLKLIKWQVSPALSPEIKQFLKLMLPGVIGAGIIQINMVVGMQIASHLEAGSIAFLYYADRLTQLPMGLVGVALGSALLPILVRDLQNKDMKSLNHSFSRAMEGAFLLGLPAMVGLILLAAPIIDVLFTHGAFSVEAGKKSALVTMAMALSIPAGILIKITAAAFFAREDTKSPMLLSLLAVMVNIPLAISLGQIWGAAGVALAASIAAYVSLLGQFILLLKRKWLGLDQRFYRHGARIFLSCFLMGGFLWLMQLWLVQSDIYQIMDHLWIKIIALMVMILSAIGVYFAFLILFKAVDYDHIRKFLRK